MLCGVENSQKNQESTEDYKKIQNYAFRAADKIGEGNFSEVYKGIDRKSGNYVAIKVIKYSSLTSKVSEQLLKNQVSILRELDHPYVIRCIDILTSKNNCYIITEFYEGSDMQRLLTRNKFFQEQDILKIIYEIYQGLCYLNSLNIIHRDFKLANIFLTNQGIPKIADFGFAVKANFPFKDINIGSPIYMSPEGMLLHQYGPKTEVWAFGILIYQLLHGQTPLSSCRNEKQLKQTILLPSKIRQGISIDLKILIERCLQVDPKKRISMKELAELPFMQRLANQFQTIKIPKEMVSTYHTSNSQSNHTLSFVKQIKTYEQGLAILQYCRLIHKTTQQFSSSLFSQWLLNICWSLQKIKISQGNTEKNMKLVETIKDYYLKYQKEHVDHNFYPTGEDIRKQCDKFMSQTQQGILNNNMSKLRLNNLSMLMNETDLLCKAVESGKISHYIKLTQAQRYLQSIKHSANKVAAQSGGFQLFKPKQ